MTQKQLAKKFKFPKGTHYYYGTSGNFCERDAWWVTLPNGLIHHIEDNESLEENESLPKRVLTAQEMEEQQKYNKDMLNLVRLAYTPTSEHILFKE
jgi:hypothetical protein